MSQPMIVAIDGPAGAGKSTVAQRIAEKLGYAYLDTGALYRALAWKALAAGVDPASSTAMSQLCRNTRLTISPANGDGFVVNVDGRPLTTELRMPEVSRAASQVAALPEVRACLRPVQQAFGRQEDLRGVVAEGRDIGTHIFPGAAAKFFLEAEPAERAKRRQQELSRPGEPQDLAQTRRELDERDRRDRQRESAPLVAAPDATVIDTTQLSVEQVVERILAVIAEKAADRGR
jgi:cytidylate kinase